MNAETALLWHPKEKFPYKAELFHMTSLIVKRVNRELDTSKKQQILKRAKNELAALFLIY